MLTAYQSQRLLKLDPQITLSNVEAILDVLMRNDTYDRVEWRHEIAGLQRWWESGISDAARQAIIDIAATTVIASEVPTALKAAEQERPSRGRKGEPTVRSAKNAPKPAASVSRKRVRR